MLKANKIILGLSLSAIAISVVSMYNTIPLIGKDPSMTEQHLHCDRPFKTTITKADGMVVEAIAHTKRCLSTSEIVSIAASMRTYIKEMPVEINSKDTQKYVDQRMAKDYNSIFIQQSEQN